MNATSALSTLFKAPSDLSLFSVSHGYTYNKPVLPSTRQALTGAAPRSRDGSVVPESQVTDSDKTANTATSHEDDDGVLMLRDALGMTMQYGKEYSDEVALTGEPGNFRFSKTREAAAVNTQAKVGTQTVASQVGTPAASNSGAGSVAAGFGSVPAVMAKNTKETEAGTPGVDGGKAAKQRRKSKVTSP
jgi:hypothetical protein